MLQMVSRNRPEQDNPASISPVDSMLTSRSPTQHWKNRYPSDDSFLLPLRPFTALLARYFVFFFFFPPLQGNTHIVKTNPPVHSLSA